MRSKEPAQNEGRSTMPCLVFTEKRLHPTSRRVSSLDPFTGPKKKSVTPTHLRVGHRKTGRAKCAEAAVVGRRGKKERVEVSKMTGQRERAP